MIKGGNAIGIGAAVAAIVVLLFFVLTFGYTNIHPTEAGVEVNKIAGKVIQIPLGVGYHFFNRWKTDIVIYIVSSRSYPQSTSKSEASQEYTLELKTNDGQNVQVDLSVIYSLNIKDVPRLHTEVGVGFEEQILMPQIRSEARIAIGSFSAEELYQGKVRDEIQKNILEKLRSSIAKYGAINIQDCLIRHFKFSPDFEKAIEQKKLAAQKVEINKNLAAAQEQEALRVEAEAKGMKLKAVQEAEGRAQAVKIEADACRYKLEQEAAGNLAIFKADAEGKKLQAEALGGGQNVVALKFAENIPDKLQIWGVPVGQNNTSIMDVSGVFGGMFKGDNKKIFKQE